MKNKLTWKERFHKYMCSLEDRGYNDPIFILYLFAEAIRISAIIWIVWTFYRIIKFYLTWI